MAVTIEPVAPEDAIAYWRGRSAQLLTSWSWQDVAAAQHRAGFTVAKGMQADVLQWLAAGVDRALEDGIAMRQFANELEPKLAAAGWWGEAEEVDPLDGRTKRVRLGSLSRLRTIFNANVNSAYAAGDWARIQRTAASHPYLMYSAVRDNRTRPEHAAWDGLILPHDHPFWETHFPPNGWNCRCHTIQVSQDLLDENGWTVSEAPQIRVRPWTNSRTGEVIDVPLGIDPGWAHNPGAVSPEAIASAALGQRLLDLPADLRAAMRLVLRSHVDPAPPGPRPEVI